MMCICMRDNSNYIVVSYNAMVKKPPISIWTRAAQNQTTWAKENSFPSRRLVSCYRCLLYIGIWRIPTWLFYSVCTDLQYIAQYCTYTDYRARKSVGGGGAGVEAEVAKTNIQLINGLKDSDLYIWCLGLTKLRIQYALYIQNVHKYAYKT
jgi:nitrate reductase gamma subunit